MKRKLRGKFGEVPPGLEVEEGGGGGWRGPQGQIIQLHKHRINLGRLTKNQEG